MRLAAAVTSTMLVVLGLAAAATAARPNESSASARSWAAAEIRTVSEASILAVEPSKFRAADPLTHGELAQALAVFGAPAVQPADPRRRVTIRQLDFRLVEALGLLPAAHAISAAARAAGLAPTSMLGTETVARLLGLRRNHPREVDDLELLPSQPATRAEAAYSFARALRLTATQIADIDKVARTFSLPALRDWERRVLGRALRFVGYPYVWTGTSEKTQKLWSTSTPGGWKAAPGGFDCSGFVWRVYKTEPFAGAPLLGKTLRGRTTYAMSGEVGKAGRLALAELRPGDLVFFGSRGSRSVPAEVGHMGIYAGHGWFVHSSEAGATLQPLQGWYAARFAWGRRPLSEAGLTA